MYFISIPYVSFDLYSLLLEQIEKYEINVYDCISNHQFSIDLYILKDYCYESFEIFELNRICKAIILKAEVDLHSELRSTNSIEDREWAKKKFSRMEKRVEKLDDS